MKQFDIFHPQQHLQGLFAEQNKEPILVTNQAGQHFLVLPLDRMNWQELFFHLYQLPSNFFAENTPKKRDMEKIEKIRGSFNAYMSSSEEFAKNKQEEIDLEERKWKK